MAGQRQVYFIHGNDEAKVSEARYALIRRLLPKGEEDGEVVELRGAGSQPQTLDKVIGRIEEEVGAASFVPDLRKVVIVYDLADLKAAGTARKKAAKKAAKSKAKPRPDAAQAALDRLQACIATVLPSTDHALVFLYQEDDEKGRRVAKGGPLYTLLQRHAVIQECSGKRLDWAFEEALLSGDARASLALLGDWIDRGGNASFRVVATLNSIVQLLLQARLQQEAERLGEASQTLFPADLRPGLGSIPDFKRRKVAAMARGMELGRLKRALEDVNALQRAFFPTGEELVVPDSKEMAERLVIGLLARDAG